MGAHWTITHWPRCAFDIFISHCAEDRDELIRPVYDRLLEMGLLPWVDWKEYPIGVRSEQALRDELVSCRHVVYFVTPAFRKQSRGWTSLEKAYGGLIQKQFVISGDELIKFELPLFFGMNRGRPVIDHTIWRSLKDKGWVHDPKSSDQVEWAARMISAFVKQGYDSANEAQRMFSALQAHGSKFSPTEIETWHRMMTFAPNDTD